MIVDCHVNVFDADQTLPLFHSLTPTSRPGAMGLAADADTLFAAMKDVDKAIIFSLRYKDAIGVDGDDEVTARAVAKYPEKFIGFAAMDPRRPDYMDLLVHAIEDLHLKGVKFGPIYNGVSLLDPRLEPVYEYLQKKNIPLTMHMGTTFGANAPINYGRPLDVDTIAARYPDLKMVMAHMGHPWYEECIVVARKHPNVYCEVSALCYRPWQYYNILVCAQEYLITKRNKIFWGTDFPWATVQESIDGLLNVNDHIEGTRLPRVTQDTMDAILHSNPLEHWWHGGYPG
ncbi:amidohydrolase [Devosia epidermidihirudinis]|uniref:Amidohydrolase n=1 Tax=Devosia epidermidihirudinis TaxID=1293439 RepID=A0A0F5QBL7_9HYPH|nr:amidohydrolase family protein [Devosia epidermidihirudinis]KKC38086.1 amidohydrolase [Devosia epidermidihirudinis]